MRQIQGKIVCFELAGNSSYRRFELSGFNCTYIRYMTRDEEEPHAFLLKRGQTEKCQKFKNMLRTDKYKLSLKPGAHLSVRGNCQTM